VYLAINGVRKRALVVTAIRVQANLKNSMVLRPPRLGDERQQAQSA
jgi:hypothetical protein